MYDFLFEKFKKEDLIDFFGDDISYYFDNCRYRIGSISYDYYLYSMFYVNLFPDDFMKDCVRWCRNLRMRKIRCKERINTISKSGNTLFLTFTISEEFINRSYSTLTEKLRDIHNMVSDNFVINADFGEKNGRLHFHSVLNCEFFDSSSWPYGHVDILRVHGDSSRLAIYVSKLSNHALKYSSYKTIYSRKKKKIKDVNYVI